MAHKKTQTEWQNEMAVKILDFTKQELYMDLRFFHLALSSLIPKADDSLHTLATDGVYLCYSSEQVLRVFQNNPKFLARACLHSILHCIFSHLWMMGRRERPLWNLACDIMVEFTIDHMENASTKRILSWLRSQVYKKLKDECSYISASVIYQQLIQLEEPVRISLQTEFYTDDHRYWPFENARASIHQNAKKRWEKIARQTHMQQELHGSGSDDKSQLFSAEIKAERSRRSYCDFLRKFSVLREELHADPDEFDLNYYTYGLRLYGNLPLIESLETREIKKIQEFVIVIDTSDSTSGDLVKNFLRETFQILHQREHFFTSCKIHILQCDDRVRSDQEICHLDQSEQFLGQFTLLGGGGTDFRPAFAYVNSLIKQHILQNLGGLLYFTDGEGTYPKNRPAYQTAFLFLGDYDTSKVPPWAMRLQLEPEEFGPAQVTHGRKL